MRHALALLAAIGISSGAVKGYAQSPRSSDETTIRTQLRLYADARKQGDGPAQARFYAEDADVWLSTTQRFTKGRTEIEQEIQLPADPNRRFSIEIENISFLSQDIGLVDATYRGSTTGRSVTGHVFYVMVKRQGQWLIRSVRATELSGLQTDSRGGRRTRATRFATYG